MLRCAIDVALGRAPVTGHDDTVFVAERHDRRAVRDTGHLRRADAGVRATAGTGGARGRTAKDLHA